MTSDDPIRLAHSESGWPGRGGRLALTEPTPGEAPGPGDCDPTRNLSRKLGLSWSTAAVVAVTETVPSDRTNVRFLVSASDLACKIGIGPRQPRDRRFRTNASL